MPVSRPNVFRPQPARTQHRLRNWQRLGIAGARRFLGLLLPFAICAAPLRAETPAAEYASKAASLALFPDYVKWPATADAPITIGIFGDDPFGGALDKLNPKRSRRLDDLKGCRIIFVTKSEGENVDAILASLGGEGVLTVGESEGFAKQGGVIGFVIEGNKVRFEINTGAARRAGLGIDLRLLKLAVRVFSS